jgi:hypothetical protein
VHFILGHRAENISNAVCEFAIHLQLSLFTYKRTITVLETGIQLCSCMLSTRPHLNRITRNPSKIAFRSFTWRIISQQEPLKLHLGRNLDKWTLFDLLVFLARPLIRFQISGKTVSTGHSGSAHMPTNSEITITVKPIFL